MGDESTMSNKTFSTSLGPGTKPKTLKKIGDKPPRAKIPPSVDAIGGTSSGARVPSAKPPRVSHHIVLCAMVRTPVDQPVVLWMYKSEYSFFHTRCRSARHHDLPPSIFDSPVVVNSFLLCPFCLSSSLIVVRVKNGIPTAQQR